MIVKDEAMVLERCLSSVSDLVDEMIVVDTGSTDDTKRIDRARAAYTDAIAIGEAPPGMGSWGGTGGVIAQKRLAELDTPADSLRGS